MTIQNYTFFSPTGTEFPVSSNADGKLYMMLSGMGLNSYKRKDWEKPIDTALNRQYTNTSIVLGGRYFELKNEVVNLNPSGVNYVHANIDLTLTTAPVSLSVEAQDNSNARDINNGDGVLKKVIDIVTTDTMGVTKAEVPKQVISFDQVEANQIREAKDTGLQFGVIVSGWTGSTPAIARLSNNVLTISVSGFSNTTAKNHTWYDVYDFTGTLGSLTAYGDTYVASFDGNNSNGQLWRARFMDGKLRVLPEAITGTTKRYGFATATFIIQ